jgi:hypothetical protein
MQHTRLRAQGWILAWLVLSVFTAVIALVAKPGDVGTKLNCGPLKSLEKTITFIISYQAF